MVYYDIHTHESSICPECRSIINIDLRKTFIPKENNIYSVGIHPWYANYELLSDVEKLAVHPQICAIGEVGLDKLASTSFEIQKTIFEAQIHLSEKVKKPLIIHCVKAWDEILATKKQINPKMPWIIHGFRGKEALAQQLINVGFYLSFGIFHNMEALSVAWNTHHLLIETDDKNIDVSEVYKKTANELHESEEVLIKEIEKTFTFLISPFS